MNILVVSDFNAELVSRYLSADRATPICHASSAPYGQVFQVLAGDVPGGKDMAAFIWTRPEGVVPGYLNLLGGEKTDIDQLLAGVDAFAAAIKNFASKYRLVMVASWVQSQNGRGLGMLDWGSDGQASCLARMNIRLSEALASIRDVSMLDGQRWLDAARPARDAKYWFSIKCPFTETVCQAAARDVKAAMRGASGLARKLVVVDLDNTLWGGIVGDDGWQALRLGGHDAVGEAYVDFQRSLKALSRRGIGVAVVSKNDEAVALGAIDSHPEMVLRRSDLVGWRINWGDKAQNIVDLTRALNLGLQSAVFIDDNPAERGRIREALPDVLVPDWPRDPSQFGDALRWLDCFDQSAITAEDRSRTRMYTQERERNESQTVASSMDEWLQSLAIEVGIDSVGEGNIKRSVQLANKTNQMNLQTRRLTELELMKWLADGNDRAAMTVTVADRFGDIGLTGLLSWQRAGDDLEVVDFILSCRAMGRQVENLMAHLAVEGARAAKRRSVVARLLPTERNRPCLDFWRNSGFTEVETNLFVWDAAQSYPKPDCISVAVGAEIQSRLPVHNSRAGVEPGLDRVAAQRPR